MQVANDSGSRSLEYRVAGTTQASSISAQEFAGCCLVLTQQALAKKDANAGTIDDAANKLVRAALLEANSSALTVLKTTAGFLASNQYQFTTDRPPPAGYQVAALSIIRACDDCLKVRDAEGKPISHAKENFLRIVQHLNAEDFGMLHLLRLAWQVPTSHQELKDQLAAVVFVEQVYHLTGKLDSYEIFKPLADFYKKLYEAYPNLIKADDSSSPAECRVQETDLRYRVIYYSSTLGLKFAASRHEQLQFSPGLKQPLAIGYTYLDSNASIGAPSGAATTQALLDFARNAQGLNLKQDIEDVVMAAHTEISKNTHPRNYLQLVDRVLRGDDSRPGNQNLRSSVMRSLVAMTYDGSFTREPYLNTEYDGQIKAVLGHLIPSKYDAFEVHRDLSTIAKAIASQPKLVKIMGGPQAACSQLCTTRNQAAAFVRGLAESGNLTSAEVHFVQQLRKDPEALRAEDTSQVAQETKRLIAACNQALLPLGIRDWWPRCRAFFGRLLQ